MDLETFESIRPFSDLSSDQKINTIQQVLLCRPDPRAALAMVAAIVFADD